MRETRHSKSSVTPIVDTLVVFGSHPGVKEGKGEPNVLRARMRRSVRSGHTLGSPTPNLISYTSLWLLPLPSILSTKKALKSLPNARKQYAGKEREGLENPYLGALMITLRIGSNS